jgi:hypothetical protein
LVEHEEIKKRDGHIFLFKVDSISWENLDETLGYMGFNGHWRGLIYECLSTSKMVVLINGSPTNEFSLQRGLMLGLLSLCAAIIEHLQPIF